MQLPVHRWFRCSAGFSAEWMQRLLTELNADDQAPSLVLDPFVGSGTTLLATDRVGIPGVAQPIDDLA